MYNSDKNLRTSVYNKLEELKLTTMKNNYESSVVEALDNNYTYDMFLNNLLEKEVDKRIENSKKRRMRLAHFPFYKYIEDLIIEELPIDAQAKLPILSSLNFIKENRNGQTIVFQVMLALGKRTLQLVWA